MKKHEETKDWISHIAKTVHENYKGRKVVLWGKYKASDLIRDKLRTEYGINMAFYVESDVAKTDGCQVLSAECLYGKAQEHYVVVPLSFSQSLKDQLTEAGFQPNIDYYYFSDCILQKDPDYYEDAHGNRVIGNYQGLKFAFSGFDSVIEIGENVSFADSVIYIHSDCRAVIGKGSRFRDSTLFLNNFSNLIVGADTSLTKSAVHIEKNASALVGENSVQEDSYLYAGNDSAIEIKQQCNTVHFSMVAENHTKVRIGEEVKICGYSIDRKTRWTIRKDSEISIGCKSFFAPGRIEMSERALLKIGNEFTICNDYLFIVDQDTDIVIGDDCMFSYDIRMFSNDCHSIFDIATGENINEVCEDGQFRKIIIGNHVWAGMTTHILYHSEIGDGSIIGTMSLVKGKIPNNCMAAGIPARVIKKNIAWSRKNGSHDIMDCGEEYIRLTQEEWKKK